MTEHSKSPIVAALVIVILATLSFSSSAAQEVKPVIVDALNRGDTALAIDLLGKEIELDPSYYLNYHTLGMIRFAQGQYRGGIEQFELALEKKKKYYASLYQMGLCYLELGELDKAQEAMEKGRKKDKKNKHRFEDGYGLVMLARENWQEADRAFRQALVGNKDNALYHVHLGDANFYQGIPSLAIIEYGKALELDTASLEVYFHWAEACLEMKDYTCAMEKLKIVLTKDSTHAPAWMRAGGIYFKAARSSQTRDDRTARFKEAIGSYKRYLELSNAQVDSSNVRVFFELAMSYVDLHGFEDAANYFGKVLSIPMEPKDVYFYYGKALWGEKEYVESAEMLLKHLDWASQQGDTYTSHVKDWEINQLLGDDYYYRKPNDFATAVSYYRKSIEARPGQKRILQNLAVAYHTMKSYEQALGFYQQRIELGIDEKSAGMYKNAGYCAMNIANLGGRDEDEDIDDEGVDDVSGGDIAADVNYYEVAVDYLKKYLEFQPDDIKVLQAVANTYLYQLGDCADGVVHYEQMLALEPNNCEAKKSLGYAYFGGVCTKNYSKALRYLTEAQQCLSSEKGVCADVDLVLWIAQCYHLRAADKAQKKQDANEDFKNAFSWYGKVLKCEPSNADAKKGQNDVRFEFVE